VGVEIEDVWRRWIRPRTAFILPPAAMLIVGILHLVSTVLALAVSYKLLKMYLKTRQPLLLSVGVSFTLIGSAYALAGISLVIPEVFWPSFLAFVVLASSSALATFGYIMLLMSYVANRLGLLAMLAHPLYWNDVASAVALILSSVFSPRERFRVGYVCMGLGHLLHGISLNIGVLDLYAAGDLLRTFGLLIILAHVMSR